MADQIQKVDVFISGAGPVGLFFALRLQAMGHSFYLCDLKEEATTETRAAGLSARTLEIFENRKIAHHILQNALILQGTQMFSGGKVQNRIDFSGDTNFPYAICIAQRETEKVLSGLLGENNIDRHTRLVWYKQNDDGVEAKVKDIHTGKEKIVQARYIVGADGTHSSVRKLTEGWDYDGYALATRFAVGDVVLRGKDAAKVLKTRGNMVLDSKFFGGFIPLGEREDGKFYYRFTCALGDYKLDAGSTDSKNKKGSTHGIDHSDYVSREEVQRLVDEAMCPLEIKIVEPSKLAIFRINERKVNSFRRGRAFLVGDAAHCHSPVGGQGLNLGFQDADNLSWKLSLVLNGLTTDPERLLDSYSTERYPIVSAVMTATGTTTRMGIQRNPIISYIFSWMLSLDFFVKPRVEWLMQLSHKIPKESTLLFQPTNQNTDLIAPGTFIRDTAPLQKRNINNGTLERKSLHRILQNAGTPQHSILWISTGPIHLRQREWSQEFWIKFNRHYKGLCSGTTGNTILRPIIIESSTHTARYKTPGYATDTSTATAAITQDTIESIFWLEPHWDAEHSISERTGLNKHMRDKPEPPAAIVVVRPDLYVAYSSVIRSPDDIDDAFTFLDSYLINKI